MVDRNVLLLACALAVPGAEPAPRKPLRVPLKITSPLIHVSAARELPDGRVLITDAKTPALLVLDPRTGATSPLGSLGPGPDQWITPGGLYAGPDGTTLLLDRGQTRTTTISPAGALQGTRSIAEHGTSSSSSADIDLQRLDARGFAYFLNPLHGRAVGAGVAREATLLRFEPVSQKKEPVATLRLSDVRTTSGGEGVTFGRTIIGSPADGWGVAPDGRVAVVRADPYRVEWYGIEGKVIHGPVVPFEKLPMTDADKQAFVSKIHGTGGASVGLPGQRSGDANRAPIEFAATKPPFEPDNVMVAPDARVWVMRTRPIEAREVVYDVFDSLGRRIDRLELPDGSRVVGFGPSSIYVRHAADAGTCELQKYTVK